MRTSEWLAVVFFVWLAVAGLTGALPTARRWRLVVSSLAMCAVVVGVARAGPIAVRDWVSALYILFGYFLSGWLFIAPSPAFEQWLVRWDRRLLGDGIRRFARWPGWVLGYLDLVYVFCFLMVPAGFAVLVVTGHGAAADRFWTVVLAAEFGSFAPLALVQSRPPWALEPPAQGDAGTHRFASMFVRRATIGANTFPSGHAAASLAVALAVMGDVPWAGLALLVFAFSISIACVVGRYHYVMDVVAGAALAVIVWAIAML